MRFKENYDLFVDTLQDILCMEDERRYFIHSFQNAVWKLTHTETKEFEILSDESDYNIKGRLLYVGLDYSF